MFVESKKAYRRVIVSLVLFSALLVSFLAMPLAPRASAHPAWNPMTWHAVVGVESRGHAIQGNVFLPGVLWINQGDTVVWTSKAGEIHTVTFMPPGKQPPPFTGAPNQVNRVGGSVYDGKSYYNSGLLSNLPSMQTPRTYQLTFSVSGDFVYYCLLHPSMIGIIHVRPAGTPYPFTQQDYDKHTQAETKAIILDGDKLISMGLHQSTNHRIFASVGDGLVSIMRFLPDYIVIHVGDKVTFMNQDPMEPHTVTFGPEQPNDFAPYGNPNAFDGSKPLNSGYIGANPMWFGKTFTVKFTKAGTYHFRCDLHADLGMLIDIVVK